MRSGRIIGQHPSAMFDTQLQAFIASIYGFWVLLSTVRKQSQTRLAAFQHWGGTLLLLPLKAFRCGVRADFKKPASLPLTCQDNFKSRTKCRSERHASTVSSTLNACRSSHGSSTRSQASVISSEAALFLRHLPVSPSSRGTCLAAHGRVSQACIRG